MKEYQQVIACLVASTHVSCAGADVVLVQPSSVSRVEDVTGLVRYTGRDDDDD